HVASTAAKDWPLIPVTRLPNERTKLPIAQWAWQFAIRPEQPMDLGRAGIRRIAEKATLRPREGIAFPPSLAGFHPRTEEEDLIWEIETRPYANVEEVQQFRIRRDGGVFVQEATASDADLVFADLNLLTYQVIGSLLFGGRVLIHAAEECGTIAAGA